MRFGANNYLIKKHLNIIMYLGHLPKLIFLMKNSLNLATHISLITKNYYCKNLMNIINFLIKSATVILIIYHLINKYSSLIKNHEIIYSYFLRG